ncbi:unnamed protein product [Gongylonema pulchrum]|uniref:CRAL-TRIO domain-containing protein n=1 Tax=Gongylonema pulchrum TaxID=637853 RepID=A0A183DVI0_9BILA|nr:unnamed protein product [Gongylonema pulchrum]
MGSAGTMQQRDRRLIQSSIVALPGCRDRFGSPLLFISPPENDAQSGTEGVATAAAAAAPSYEELVSVISYLAQIPDERARRLGFTVLIDGRRAPLKHVRNALRACQQALYRQIRLVLIVQPEKFLYQQKLNFELIKEAYQFKSTLISIHKLSRFVDVTQLPDIFGGTFQYEPNSWIRLRENFVTKANNWIQSRRKHEKLAGATTSDESNDSADERRASELNELLKMGTDGVATATAAAAPSYEELVSVISYLAQIPDERARRLGFTVLIDGRRAPLKHVRNALRACQQALYRQIRLVLIVQPEKFLYQQKLNFELIKEAYQFKVIT